MTQTPNYNGTYVASSGATGPVTLVLQQDAQGRVTGTWAASGQTYQINAVLGDQGAALGTVVGPTGGAYIAAEFQGAQLAVTLFEANASNQPDYSKSQGLTFTRKEGGAAGAAPAPAPVMGGLLGGGQGAPPAPAAMPAPHAAPAAGGSSFPGWNVRYAVPAGWQLGQNLGRLHVLASTTQAGAIFVATGLYASFDEMVADLSKFYQSMNLQATPAEQPSQQTIAGMRALTATYASMDQMGRPVQGRYVALLTPHGTGVGVLGMTTPEQMTGLRATVDRLAASVQAQAPQVNQQAVAALAGKWMYYAGKAEGVSSVTGGASRSHEEFVTFDGRGGFAWESSTSVMVTTPSVTSGAGAAGGAGANSDQGTYTVIGTTLVLKGRQGQMAFELQLGGDRFTADGRQYLKTN
ncbi:MAG: hypothetical protein ACREMR_03720 [Gemmatimonadales bacterium]